MQNKTISHQSQEIIHQHLSSYLIGLMTFNQYNNLTSKILFQSFVHFKHCNSKTIYTFDLCKTKMILYRTKKSTGKISFQLKLFWRK